MNIVQQKTKVGPLGLLHDGFLKIVAQELLLTMAVKLAPFIIIIIIIIIIITKEKD